LIFAGLAAALFSNAREANRQKQEAVKQEAKAKTTSVQADFDLAVMYQKQSDSVGPPCSRPANVRRRKTPAAVRGFAATRLSLVFGPDGANAP
jgi:hypothetical protein